MRSIDLHPTPASLYYREYTASPRFAQVIECFWRHRTTDRQPAFRVLPDGCMDLLFEAPPNNVGSAALRVIGTMTHAQTHSIPARHVTFGVRFHPGMACRALSLPPATEILDTHLTFENSAGAAAARRLHEQLNESPSAARFIALVEGSLREPSALDPVEKALAWLAQNHGQVPIDELASATGLSSRQFRRICLHRTGLTPKQLARILRFRCAAGRAGHHGLAPSLNLGPSQRADWAQIALDCGYYDQAHLINDFREFSGSAPAQFSRGELAASR